MSPLSEWISASELDNTVKDLLCTVAERDEDYAAFIYPNAAHIEAIKNEKKESLAQLKLIHVLFINAMDNNSIATADGSVFTVIPDGDHICIQNSKNDKFILTKTTEYPTVLSLEDGSKLVGNNTYDTRSITGGVDPPFALSKGLSMIQDFAAGIEKAYVDNSKNAGIDPYLGAVTSFLRYLEIENLNLLESLIPVMDTNPMISFYLLFQPYRSKGKYLVDRTYIFDNNNVLKFSLTAYGNDAVEEYYRFLYYEPNKNSKAASAKVFSDSKSIKAEVAKILEQLHNMLNTAHNPAPDILIAEVRQIYETLRTKNRLGKLDNILPNVEIFESDQLLWIDEMKFWANEFVKKLTSNPEKFPQMICGLREIFPGDNFTSELTVNNINNVDRCGSSRPVVEFALKTFLKEAPLMVTACGKIRTTTGGASHKSRVTLNKMKNINGISTQTLNELRAYVKQNGKLPHAVTGLL